MKPRLSMKIELTLPNPSGGPSKKFLVDRRLKAEWNEDHEKVTQQILDEIRNYRGSFIGDVIQSLSMIVSSELDLSTKDSVRRDQVNRWTASLIDSMIYTGIREGIHRQLSEMTEVIQWDGDVLKMDPVTAEEMKNVDIDNLMSLLAPKIKQSLYLISKDVSNVTKV